MIQSFSTSKEVWNFNMVPNFTPPWPAGLAAMGSHPSKYFGRLVLFTFTAISICLTS